MRSAGISFLIVIGFLLALGSCGSNVDEKKKGGDSVVAGTGAAAGTGGGATGVDGGTIERSTEAKLILEPGFQNVHAESPSKGVILLTGTVASEGERVRADSIARGTSGVREVENRIIVAK